MICPRCDDQFRPDRHHQLDAADLIEDMPRQLKAERVRRRLSCIEAGEQIGISGPTVSKVERGHIGNGTTAVLILRWLAGGS